jgi:hypothetical protein
MWRRPVEPRNEVTAFAGVVRYCMSWEARVNLNSIVIVSLQTPREKVWGELIGLEAPGITVRGIDLNSFNDFITQVLHPEGDRVGLATLFFPMQRVERIALDEPSGSIPSLADVFEQKVGKSLKDYLTLFA